MEYGYIENGYLRAREVTQEQIATLSSQYKPVDELDLEQLKYDEGYFVKAVPYDAGERIAYRYEMIVDKQYILSKISALKAQLADGDYQVIKCYEASLVNEELPYNIQELCDTRQQLRNQINELEAKLA